MPKRKKKTKNQRIKDLFLDRPTSHDGWPEGHKGSWVNKTPVNVQIANWLDSMGLLADKDNAVLSEEDLRYLIRTLLIESDIY